MKYLLTAMFVFMISLASAQIVNIPNPELKTALLTYTGFVIDTNGDGEIQLSEAQAVHSLYLEHGITNDLTWLQSFSNLDTLSLYSWPPTLINFDISGMTTLRSVSCESKAMQSVNLSGCSNLIYADINRYTAFPDVAITSLNISGTPRLKDFMCNTVVMPEVDLRQQDSLVNVTFYYASQIGVIKIGGLPMLQKITVSGHTGLIDAESAPVLKAIDVTGGSQVFPIVDSMNVHGCVSLTYLVLGTEYSAAGIDLSTNVNLKTLGGGSSTLSSLDFSNCNRSVHVTGLFSNLHYLNIKNGHLDTLFINPAINPTQQIYVCTDEFETRPIDSMLFVRGWTMDNTVINPFCTASANGGAYNTMTGTVRLDRELNGCDNADSLLPYVAVKVTNAMGYSTVRYTRDPFGDYRFYDTTGNFTVRPYFPVPYFVVNPVSSNVVFNTVDYSNSVNDFCITPNGNHNQLDITIVPAHRARPGFTCQYIIYYRNRGTTTLSGNVELNYDNNKMIYAASSQIPSQSSGLLNWNYVNLLPLETKYITVDFNILPVPVNNIGDTLMFFATINPVAGDEIPANNNFILPQLVSASQDPNEKQCLQGEKLDITNIGDNLDYIIHFQNLGTDTAFNVVVTDTLSNHLDWESFEITGISHPCEVQRKDNKLQFYFKDIHLPYSAINEPASHGFVAFKVKTMNTLAIGDSINNRASIYFDFNPAIVTNMATTIVSPTSNVAVKLEYFSLATRNETNLLTWKAPSTNGTTHFGIERSSDGIHFSNFGNITASVDRCQLSFNFTDEKPFDGKTYYRLNIKDADGTSFYSKVLVARKTKSGLSVNAIVSDQKNTSIYLNASKEQNVQMKIIAADGRLLYNQSKTIEAGNSTLNLQLRNLATGIYTLIIYTNEGQLITKRFVK